MPPETSSAADSAGRTARLGALAPSSEEQALLAAVLATDRKAAAEFVARYADAVYAYVSRRLAPRADLVEDIVQDVFLVAQRRPRPAFNGGSLTEESKSAPRCPICSRHPLNRRRRRHKRISS